MRRIRKATVHQMPRMHRFIRKTVLTGIRDCPIRAPGKFLPRTERVMPLNTTDVNYMRVPFSTQVAYFVHGY